MLNPKLKLNPKIFNADCEQVPIRKGFGEGLLRAGELDKNVVALCADLTESTQMIFFKEKFPERYIEVGIAEQNLATIASGLANYGKIPCIATYAVFSPGRNWEQIRTTIALANVPVKIMGMHTGVSVGPDGATHQALEDITLMRVLPNMTIFVPCDREEARKAVLTAITNDKPTYIRFTRHDTPVFTTLKTPFEAGKAEYIWRSAEPRVAIMGAGPLLYEALQAARILEERGIGTSVLNLHSIKPMDIAKVLEAVRDAGAVVTVEEHQILGGVGGTIAEILV
ncbi:MAG: Transketolase, central region, partial [Parcubacteria group bacterium GW2011_GWF2_42_7]